MAERELEETLEKERMNKVEKEFGSMLLEANRITKSSSASRTIVLNGGETEEESDEWEDDGDDEIDGDLQKRFLALVWESDNLNISLDEMLEKLFIGKRERQEKEQPQPTVSNAEKATNELANDQKVQKKST